MNPIFAIDGYKIGHIDQYPKGITQVWSNWTPRASRIKEVDHVIHFGLQYFLKKVLMDDFYMYFFYRKKEIVVNEYKEVIGKYLGIEPRTEHIAALWDRYYLPIKIYSLPEGTATPLNTPSVVITNTDPKFFWLPNFLETMLSAYLWKASTSATTALRYRKILEKWGAAAGEKDLSYIDYQAHDFSFRGMSGVEDAILSGLGHLTSFKGTDSVPVVVAAKDYYDSPIVQSSISATEHSVMCAGEESGEFETFKRLITEIYPNSPVSIVSDTWDLWKVLTDYVPRLRKEILERPSVTVLRPDSGVPELIICGDPNSDNVNARKGVLRLLAEALGTVERKGQLPLIDNARAIYGDSITPERAEEILRRTVTELKLSPQNINFGVGSFTYTYCTRDTYGFAMKATAIKKDGEIIPIFKKPVTDSGTKHSRRGIVSVWESPEGLITKEESTEEDLNNCAYSIVFENGKLYNTQTMDQIRERIKRYYKDVT